MPTYEYRCQQCGHQFEVFASMSDPAPEQCEACQASGTLEKVLFPVAVHYKGSGFYSTDYSGKKSSNAGASAGSAGDSGSSSGDSGSGTGSSDSGSGSSTSSSSNDG